MLLVCFNLKKWRECSNYAIRGNEKMLSMIALVDEYERDVVVSGGVFRMIEDNDDSDVVESHARLVEKLTLTGKKTSQDER